MTEGVADALPRGLAMKSPLAWGGVAVFACFVWSFYWGGTFRAAILLYGGEVSLNHATIAGKRTALPDKKKRGGETVYHLTYLHKLQGGRGPVPFTRDVVVDAATYKKARKGDGIPIVYSTYDPSVFELTTLAGPPYEEVALAIVGTAVLGGVTTLASAFALGLSTIDWAARRRKPQSDWEDQGDDFEY